MTTATTAPVSINLLPAPARAALRRRAQLRRCAAGVAAYCAALCLGLTAWAVVATPEPPAPARLEALRRDRDELRSEAAARQRQLNAARARVESLRQVVERPAWDLLLGVVGAQAGGDVALRGLTLEPASASTASPAPVSNAGQKTTASYVLQLRGVGRDYPAVSSFVLRLERTGLFAEVRLIGTTREPVAAGEGVGFDVRCLLSEAAR